MGIRGSRNFPEDNSAIVVGRDAERVARGGRLSYR